MSTKPADEHLKPAAILAAAEAWFARQVEIVQQCHGKRWPEHQKWVEQYLKEELRQRLIARGWRPKR